VNIDYQYEVHVDEKHMNPESIKKISKLVHNMAHETVYVDNNKNSGSETILLKLRIENPLECLTYDHGLIEVVGIEKLSMLKDYSLLEK